MDAWRNARLAKFGGADPGPNASSSSASSSAAEPTTAASEQPAPANVETVSAVSMTPQAFEILSNLLTSIRESVDGLPEKFANALAAHAGAQAGAQAGAPNSLAVQVQPAPSFGPVVSNVLPASLAIAPASNAHGVTGAASLAVVPVSNPHGVNGAVENNACGVCHMQLNKSSNDLWAFDNCGHYPFCSACVDQLKSNLQANACPFCTEVGCAVKLRFEDE